MLQQLLDTARVECEDCRNGHRGRARAARSHNRFFNEPWGYPGYRDGYW
jgi:hypothetical protein